MRMTLKMAWLAAALVFVSAGAQAQQPQQPLKIFDAHMHWNQEPNPFYALDKIVEVFRRNNITGVLATSRPNKGTHQLMEAKPEGLWIVPFIRPYRIRADIQTWFEDPSIWDLIQEEYKRGYYRGIGEFHIYGKSASSDLVKRIVNFAVERDLWLHAHCDEEALLILFGHNPKARIIWAHTGFSTPPARVAELLKIHPGLIGEMSYRGGIMAGGQLAPEWRELFTRHSERFVLGSDTWINERWFSYDAIFKEYRSWLAQLPPEPAARIAHGNAERIFGEKKAAAN